eukprot:CAMPEP_0183715866 /NCGR_PEP_ID=MMETSP0737-20130205/9944_1 /TAXON_ID=385413 /ORGANISM="Thalassiosira miniscula, Strain CCMP1093" /LENGTH=596 /DNA_ID=CAMNT_0025945035 /DNA_START=46 /DNA_END=1837 /DNA_ORIENTATION=+
MMKLPCCVAIVGIGLQAGTATASPAFDSVSNPPVGSPSLGPPLRTKLLQPPMKRTSLAFATRQPSRCRRSNSNLVANAPLASRGGPPSATRLFMLSSDQFERMSLLIAPLTASFWLTDALYDLATFTFGLLFMFAAASYFATTAATTTEEEEKEEPLPVAMAYANGGSVGSSDGDGVVTTTTTESSTSSQEDDLLTPETYADSRSAKRAVKDTILSKASEAFQSTDFAHEPHLSPELEDAEAAYEVALAASAAHELAESARKESHQSRAAMLERERELEWIEQHGEDGGEDDADVSMGTASKAEAFQRSLLAAQFTNNKATKQPQDSFRNTLLSAKTEVESFQRSLLAAQLANNKAKALLKNQMQESFQRSLLSARIANDANVKKETSSSSAEEELQKEEWLGSEVRAASMGGQECLPFDVASAAASSAAAHALAEVEEQEEEEEEEEAKVEDDVTAPAAVASVVAETAERMIVAEDIADLYQQIASDSKPQEKETAEQPMIHDDIQSYVQQKGIEQTKEKLSLKKNTANTSADSSSPSSKELAPPKSTNSDNESVIQKALRQGFVRRRRNGRRYIFAALAVEFVGDCCLPISGKV